MDAIDRLAFSLERNQWKWTGDDEYKREMRSKAINAIKQIVKEFSGDDDIFNMSPVSAIQEIYYEKDVKYTLPSE